MSVSPKKPGFKQKYDYLLQHLRTRILSSELKPDDYLPSENDLAEQFHISRPSVRKIIAELAQEGLVETVHGRGSIVRGPDIEGGLIRLKLYWYSPSPEYTMIERIVAGFNEQYRHIKVDIIPIDIEHYYRGVLLSEEQPDLIGFSSNFLINLMEQGIEQILTPMDQLQIQPEIDACHSKLLRSLTADKRLYAVPIAFSPIVLVYNKALFRKAGVELPSNEWTWDDLLEAAIQLTQSSGERVEQYGFALSAPNNRWPHFVFQNGGQFVRNGRFILNNKKLFEAVHYIQNLIYKYKVSPLYTMGGTAEGDELFEREKVAMVMTTYYFLEGFKKSGIDWDLVAFPRGRQNASFVTTTALGVGKNCKYPEAASVLIRYFLSKPVQAQIKQSSFSIPAHKEVSVSRQYPHPDIPGEGYYAFESVVDHAFSMNDLGLPLAQFVQMRKRMSLVWSNMETVENVWKELGEKFK